MVRSIEKVAELFTRFPGIGPRQAQRFVYFLLSQEAPFIKELAKQLRSLPDTIVQCSACQRFFEDDRSATTICELCSEARRSPELLLIVEKDADIAVVERSGSYDGHYFVLGGTIPLPTEKPEAAVRAGTLLTLVEKRVSQGLTEIIFGLSASPEGEHTALYLHSALQPLAKRHTLTLSTLGRGLSTGTELEYSDSDTIAHALKNRH